MPSSSPFCPSTAELRIERLAVVDGLITITLVGRRTEVPCSACGTPTGRVHSHYPRTFADLPWQGTPVRLAVTVRRFFCDVTGASAASSPSACRTRRPATRGGPAAPRPCSSWSASR